MRLISQNGMYDVPYELCTIRIDEMPINVFIEALLVSGSCITLGKYSTKKKALDVMEEIRNEYVNCEFSWYQLPKDEEVTCMD